MSWRDKAHRIIGELSRQSYMEANGLTPSGRIRKNHVPYSIPQVAVDLIDCLNTDDEERAKAIFLYARY